MQFKRTLPLVALLFTLALATVDLSAEDHKVVIIDKDLNAFNKLELSGVFNVTLIAGDVEKVHIETTEDLYDDIQFKENNGLLSIVTSKRLKNRKNIKMDIILMYKDIKYLEINSVGKTNTENAISADNFELKISSVGNTNLEMEVTELTCSISAVGDVHFNGSAESADIKMSAVGELRAKDFKVQHLTMRNSGIGSVEVYASETIELSNAGIGNVSYYGNPKRSNVKSAGIGSVKKK